MRQWKHFFMCHRHRKLLPNFSCFLFSLYLLPFPTLYHRLLHFLGTLDACPSLTWHARLHCPQRPLWPFSRTFRHLYFLILLFLCATLRDPFPIPQTLLSFIRTRIATSIFVRKNARRVLVFSARVALQNQIYQRKIKK